MPAHDSIRDVRGIGDIHILSSDLTAEAVEQITAAGRVAWDIETDGLDPLTAQIGTCQLSIESGRTFVITGLTQSHPERLAHLLANPDVLKVFHHAPFDLSFMRHAWEVKPVNAACTKVASKLLNPQARSSEHSLKHLMWQNFEIALDKEVRFTDWLSDSLSARQIEYAVGDVVKLLSLYDLLKRRLRAEGLLDLYERCCAFLPSHTELRLHGMPDPFRY
ncbi:ribonuclease D [Streptomyces canus]|uniref:ribonuclease D n=1 Tax=Streptomyces canus TaxID=58343 RepID=UPI0022537426|nr:ribonuclease D [Streptomyces canus]MCX5255516.1 ribonuclease D [Streptomyces canus]